MLNSRTFMDKPAYDFILLFNKATGSDRIYYFMIDPRTKDRMFPRMNTTIFPKLRNNVGYRPVVYGGQLYIIGGRDWTSGEKSGQVWKYDPVSVRWSTCASLNEPRCRFTVDVLGGKIYITGGEVGSGKVTDSVEVYDPETNTWAVIKPLPRPRVDHASCVCGNRLYVSGGISNIKHQCSNVFWVFDPLTSEWTDPCPNLTLPDEREKHIMVPVKDENIHFLGGRGFDQELFQEKDEANMCSYSIKNDGVTKRPRVWDNDHPHISRTRAQPGYMTLGRRIYLFGGKSFQKDKEVLEVDFYSPKQRKWRTVFNLPSRYSYANVDCVKLNIPVHNRDFNFSDIRLYDRWIMW